MCRACTDANPRRCPSSSGEIRSQRDRSAYAAKKAAGVTKKPTTKAPSKTRSGVKGGMTDTAVPEVAPASTVPSIADVRELADGVGDLYSPDTRYSDRAKALVAKYGSEDRAVVALGDAVTARAEMHAGVTADDIAAGTMAERLNSELAAAGVRGRLKLDSLNTQMAELQSIVKSRRSTLQEKIEANSKRNQLVAEYNTAIRSAEFKDAQVQLQAAQNGVTGDSGEKLAKLRDGYTKAIAEVRPLGGTLTLAEKTAPKANKVFNEAAQVYPSDWIDASNSQPAPLAKIAVARAHYSHGHVELTRKKMPVSYPVLARVGEDKAASNDVHYEYTLDPNQEGVPADRVRWINTRYETKTKWDENTPVPKGRGWETYTTERGDSYYRRPKTRLKTLEAERVPEILTNVDKATVAGVGEHQRVATHELAHRFQYTVPGIHEMEQQFIVRRTTLADGTREKPVNVSGGKTTEMGYADSFPDAYMGRDYTYGKVNKSEKGTEILSVGMESLFAGKQGGFVGAGRYNRDDESRSFILGILASAGRKN